jgi:hypothetical protein
LVEQNIFILPNIILFNNIYFQYILQIEFNKTYLNDYYFKSISNKILDILPYNDEINNLILKFRSSHIYLDIWYKNCFNNCDRYYRMMKTAYHNIYIRNLISPIVKNKAQFHIHKNIIQNNNILLTIFRPNYDDGVWELLPILEKIYIINKNNTYKIYRHDLDINPLLSKNHFNHNTKKKKFILTENITLTGKHKNMYLLNLENQFNKELQLNDDDDDDKIIFEIYTLSENKKTAYIYIEISSK